jgi:DNA-binding MarR family transcriptional regulator
MERARKSGLQELQPLGTAADALATLERITDHLRRELHLLLRAHGMTTTQYNVLRILRSVAPGGLTCSELGTRLAGADPDITRLLDRLAKHGLVRRHRNALDRRAVLTEITDEGMRMLDSVAPLLDARIGSLFDHMAPDRLQLLIELLKEATPAVKRNGEHTSADAGIEGWLKQQQMQ